jgi:hypothetical protein
MMSQKMGDIRDALDAVGYPSDVEQQVRVLISHIRLGHGETQLSHG